MMTCHYTDLGSAPDWLNQISHAAPTNQTHDPDPGSDTSSVWNFCARLSDVIIGVANVGCFLRLGKGFLAKRTTSVSLHFSRSLHSMAVLSSRVSSPPFIT